MKLILPAALVETLKQELRRAGSREIGGVMVGEYLCDQTFRLADISVQTSGGSRAHFERDLEHSTSFLKEFFARTGHDYSRFNYLGEWHSHPSFAAMPSGQDVATMREIVQDPKVGVHFAVLLIVRLVRRSDLELSATVFRPHATPINAEMELEVFQQSQKESLFQRFIDLFR
ncbi:Mov34/MPN/PAD-1 family protein [Bradyrhizobium huanghuaihaiense]|uniref:Mov34/MPN/PAD-1 family protein n=1 Tax=Bradyrhizobium huanghuaihaiense TaxID=990078 RepID=UPI0021A989CD|nr:Mov34/MPN/PAD-1 family protein [Bradyrhizobium sp. CB3035]UWU75982.1 Mov34/MPN/PAD-1 family protein [Bradyrhizobium sp. CB3035]